MTTFLNLDLDKRIQWRFLIRHLIYAMIWILGIWLIVFRGDYNLYTNIPHNWVPMIIPFAFIIMVVILMRKSKWYYNLIFLFYPILIVLWFLPKLILNKGKIYLLSSYLNFIYLRIKKIKNSITHITLLTAVVLLLLITDSDIVRICSMVYLSFFYFKIVVKYVKQSTEPAQIFGISIEAYFDELIISPEKSHGIIKNYEEVQADEKLSEKERNLKRVKRLIIVNTIFEHLGKNLSSFKGKRAFVVSWIYKLLGFVIITFCYYTFMNLELYIIDKSNFDANGNPQLFDFFYYTLKTITFGNIDLIRPVSILARSIEILSFLTIGIFILVIATSVIYSMRQDRINDNIKKATEVCLSQKKFINNRIINHYKMDINSVFKEAKSIKASIDNIKKSIERIL